MSRPLSLLIRLSLAAIALACGGELAAKHIVGGEVTYECLGDAGPSDKRYRVTVTIYRDCASFGADFDGGPNSSGGFAMTIFRGSELVREERIGRSGLTITSLDPNLTNPCIELPPGVCVERGVYVTEVVLPVSDEVYTISYQRCCRNNTISNITRPSQAGATYLVEITPLAQRACNSTPVFDNFPPLVICADELLRFDAGATDPDGDRLVYSLCEPYYGGGSITSGAAVNGFDGVMPNPESPPPYDAIVFRQGFSAEAPLDGTLTIDSNTGLLQARPRAIGQYVVCITVLEYRGDELIGEVRRDFQFNVVACDPRISARAAAAVDGDLTDPSRILVCGDKRVDLVDVSTDQRFIQEVEWVVPGTSDGLVRDRNREIGVTFDDYGSYPAQLIVNPGLVCDDTTDFTLVLVPPTAVDFTFVYDTCDYGPVRFATASSTEAGSIASYAWSLDDGTDTIGTGFSYLYAGGGRKRVTHVVTDEAGCVEDTVKVFDFFPLPPSLEFDIGFDGACAPAEVPFAFGGGVVTENYETFWSFGDGTSSEELSPVHRYAEPGFYDIYARVRSPSECELDSQIVRPLQVLESPEAAFAFAPQTIDTRDTEVAFTDRSFGAASWDWRFDSLGNSRETDPRFVFPDSGSYEIRLAITHLNNCPDTAIQRLRVEPFQTLYLPNAFLPDGNGENVAFRPAGFLRYVTDFQMQIFNRWGEIIFETGDMEAGWDGTNQRNGQKATPGVYLYLVNHGGIDGPREYQGTVTLVE